MPRSRQHIIHNPHTRQPAPFHNHHLHQLLVEAQKTWTMLRVAAVTGSEKSPPGGETAPTMVTLPFRIGLAPAQVTLPARS
jgi:hypothetical protein